MNKQIETLLSYLTFHLGDELFAANVDKVMEILEVPKVTKVPQSPKFMKGVINLRGNVLPIIDARTKFGLPQADATINTCIIVLNIVMEGQPIVIGAIVDNVQEVTEIDSNAIQPAPTIGSKYKSEFIEGMVKSDDQFIMILDIDKVFSSEEANILQELTHNIQE